MNEISDLFLDSKKTVEKDGRIIHSRVTNHENRGVTSSTTVVNPDGTLYSRSVYYNFNRDGSGIIRTRTYEEK